MTELRRRSGESSNPPMDQTPQSPRVNLVLAGIARALQLVSDAEQAYQDFDPGAAALQMAADRAHCELLRAICRLSEDEADQVEPQFSALEIRLLRLPADPPDSATFRR